MNSPDIVALLLAAASLVCLSGCVGGLGRTTSSVERTQSDEEEAPSEPPPPKSPSPEPSADPMLSTDTLLPAPADFANTRIGSEDYPIPVYARHLKGLRICLDPGHGGDAHKRAYKRGPTGVREAEVNLRVARYLRDFLVSAGAEVLLTRDEDMALSLRDRAAKANEWGADLFISCHHNAVGKPTVNRTSVWYHRDVDCRPANLDLARHLCWGLCDALRLPQTTGIPLKSDQLMFRSGFGVLRHARVTAALIESSFFTHPEEEQRLRDPSYNLREAHGLFIGLARYASGGLPRAELIEPQSASVAPSQPVTLVFRLDDGLRSRRDWGADRQMILSDSIAVRMDGEPVAHVFENKGYKLTVDLPKGLILGKHRVEVQFQNMFKNSVLNPFFTIEARPPDAVADEGQAS